MRILGTLGTAVSCLLFKMNNIFLGLVLKSDALSIVVRTIEMIDFMITISIEKTRMPCLYKDRNTWKKIKIEVIPHAFLVYQHLTY